MRTYQFLFQQKTGAGNEVSHLHANLGRFTIKHKLLQGYRRAGAQKSFLASVVKHGKQLLGGDGEDGRPAFHNILMSNAEEN